MKEIVGILSRTVENVSKFLSLLCVFVNMPGTLATLYSFLKTYFHFRDAVHEATKFIYEADLRYMLPHRPTISDRLHV